MPIMPLRKVKLPQETISLQLFEPRYRLLFKLVKQASSRRFGLVVADQQQGTMESIGSLCELTHYIPVPERSATHAAEACYADVHAAPKITLVTSCGLTFIDMPTNLSLFFSTVQQTVRATQT